MIERGDPCQLQGGVILNNFFRKHRPSRDEKQFSRQLEQALAASKKESGTNVSVNSEPIPSDTDTPSINTSSAARTAEGSKDDDFVPGESVSSDESEEESSSAVDDDEDSDFSASPQPKKRRKKNMKENVKSAPKGKQTKAKKPTAKPNVSVDKLTTNSLPKKAARQTAIKVTPAKPMVQKSTPSIAHVPSLKVNSADTVKESKSSLASVKSEGGNPGVLGVNKRVLNWTPPAKVGEGKTKTDALSSKPTHVRSGSSGGGTPVIRVGLSRNARVKSLHTNIKT